MSDNRFSSEGWNPSAARRMLAHEKLEPADLLAKVRDSLRPVNHAWLAHRLEALWNSTSHPASMKAADWLTETGRLLADLPFDVLQFAIDEAVKQAERGFMPSVGEIRAIAVPMVEERRKQERRLEMLSSPAGALPPPPAAPKYWRPKEGETDAILREVGFERSPGSVPVKRHDGPRRMPTREDYIALGVDPSVLDRLDTERVG